ncbi:histidine kinase [Flavobacteriaceae bacterium UJ101]|nr:histidine kinase [Flavobacteriaceae bacterium UJ101]
MKSGVKNIVVALVLSLCIGGLFFIVNDRFTTHASPIVYFLFWLIIASCFAIPSFLLAVLLDRFFPWSTFKNRLFITIVANLVLLFALSVLLSYAEISLYSEKQYTLSEYVLSRKGQLKIFFYFVLALMFSFFFHAKGFYEALIASKKREIQLIEEKKETELSALKAQIDPHFLFNNLNVLHALIDENPEKAQEFVGELSKVYRYVLEAKDQEVVVLEDEINFAKRYFNLLQKRFEKGIELQVEVSSLMKKMVPLTLQTALENAIKHNHISEENPLKIMIVEDHNSLIIRNNYQKKEVLHSNKIGLRNLRKRYELLNHKLEIQQTEDWFELRIPLIGLKMSEK